MALAENSEKKNKKKPRGKPFAKGDPRINRNGAPRVGLSWREILDDIGNLDGEQAAERAGRIFRDLTKYPKGVTLKELAAISYYIRMVNDPNGSLLVAVADRTDGKVQDKIDITSQGESMKVEFDYSKLVSNIAPRPAGDNQTPGEGENDLHGQTVGKDDNGGSDRA